MHGAVAFASRQHPTHVHRAIVGGRLAQSRGLSCGTATTRHAFISVTLWCGFRSPTPPPTPSWSPRMASGGILQV